MDLRLIPDCHLPTHRLSGINGEMGCAPMEQCAWHGNAHACLHARSFSRVVARSFKACVSYPGSSLSSGEQKCLGRCMDRYQDVSSVCSMPALPTFVQSLNVEAPQSPASNSPCHMCPQATNVVTKAVLGQQ